MRRVAAFAVSLVACLAAQFSGRADDGCKLQKLASLEVEFWGNLPLIPVSINGTQSYFIADTGSALTVIFNSTASQLGLEMDNFDRKRIRFSGVGGGSGEVHATEIGEFKIGGATIKDFKMMVGGNLSSPAAKAAGLLGEDFFRDYDVEFDLQHHRINLFRAHDCEDKSLAYWTDTYGVVPFEVGRGAAMILLPVSVNDRPFSAQLDSGAHASFMTIEAAERVGVTDETPGVEPAQSLSGLGQNSVAAWIAPFQSFTIADETVKTVKLRVADALNLHWRGYATLRNQSKIDDKTIGYQSVTVMNTDMMLGEDFLTSHRVMVSHSQHKVYFSYLGGPVFKPHQPPPAE